MEHSPPPFFKRGPAPLVRLFFFASLSLALLVLDARFRYTEAVRSALALVVYPIQRIAIAPIDFLEGVAGYFSSQSQLLDENAALRAQALANSQDALRFQAALLARLHVVGARRTLGLVGQHQHEEAAVDARRGPADDACEGVLGVALDFHHGGDRQAGRVRAVDARGHQAIAVLDLGVGRHEAQLEHARVAAAERHRAQAVSQHLHRNRLIRVGQQRHFGKQRMHARHLADDAGFVGHRASRTHAVPPAAVDEHLV